MYKIYHVLYLHLHLLCTRFYGNQTNSSGKTVATVAKNFSKTVTGSDP